MELAIRPDGTIHLIYTELIPLREFGSLLIRRASHVEPSPDGRWLADLSSVDGPKLGSFTSRSEALAAEVRWLEQHWLSSPVADF